MTQFPVAYIPHSHLLTEDILEHVFANLGPQGTARCAIVCRTWKSVVYQSRSLWRQFCNSTFGFSQGDPLADWRVVYGYLSEKSREPQQLLQDNVRVLFADDGGGYMFFLAHRAVKHNDQAWCTSTNVNENVDLVVQTQSPALISGFALQNPGTDYSAPLHEALVFASYDSIDLDAARIFDGSNGESWVNTFEGPFSVDMPASQESIRKRIRDDQTSAFKALMNPRLEPVPPRHDGLVRTITSIHQPQREILKPLTAFCTPPLPLAYTAFISRRIPPTVARHIHFKLLNSHKTPGVVADNIDVLALLTYGVPLPELPRLVGTENSEIPTPNYRRIHTLREDPDGDAQEVFRLFH